MINTTIYLTGRTAYRREHDFIKHCKKSEVASLAENRTSFIAIINKDAVKKYDKAFQLAGFYMADIAEYDSDSYKLTYNHI